MMNAAGGVTGDERAAALAAVRAATSLTRAAQGQLLAGDTLTKGDDSPVTVADFAVQALVCGTLAGALGEIELVGEEDAADLAGDAHRTLRDGVVALVQRQRAGVDAGTVLDWINLGAADGHADRFWTLDPIDGTKGFVRGDQFAIALALIERGEVVLGVLGCPNLPNPDGTRGAVFVAANGRCQVYAGDRDTPLPVQVASPATLAEARICESVEAAHSDHEQSAEIARRLGIVGGPYRIDSQCKYAVVARGEASIYLRLPTRADYREKIWDHAAGKFVVEQAGGTVTDVDGRPLDFSRGRLLAANRGVICTNGPFHFDVVAAVAAVLG
jgi:HAL2 family 3'(2'),5'-bisphosphate nucleotidase